MRESPPQRAKSTKGFGLCIFAADARSLSGRARLELMNSKSFSRPFIIFIARDVYTRRVSMERRFSHWNARIASNTAYRIARTRHRDDRPIFLRVVRSLSADKLLVIFHVFALVRKEWCAAFSHHSHPVQCREHIITRVIRRHVNF